MQVNIYTLDFTFGGWTGHERVEIDLALLFIRIDLPAVGDENYKNTFHLAVSLTIPQLLEFNAGS